MLLGGNRQTDRQNRQAPQMWYRGYNTKALSLLISGRMVIDHNNPVQAYVRVDTQTGEKQTWFPGVRCFCEELVFVPGPKAATQETDGFLLGMVFDAAQNRSFLAVSLCMP